MLEKIIEHHDSWAASVFFVNAHTLNVATADPAYREILNAANLVFADGTGVRWAARLQGVRVVENLTGTDLVPAWFRATFDRGHSCFLLGADPLTIELAADFARRTFPGWRLSGYHDGYLTDELTEGVVVDAINAAKPDVLLVGMGNPLQETMDPSAFARASRAGVHGRGRLVRLLGRQREPLAELAPPAWT